jgi:hypothetical protein
MGIGYIQEISPAYVGRRYFQHSAIPEDTATHFRVEIIPETQD